MKKTKIALLIFTILSMTILSSGCWNYREVDKLSIVAGIAIDREENDKFEMTVELIQISGGRETKMMSELITADGKTLFDAARNIISITGKRLYWSHTMVIIISKEIARDGVSKVLEWYNRDAETRENVNVLISEEKTAKEILDGQVTTEKILSFSIDEAIENQKSLSKAPKTNILDYDMQLESIGSSSVFPSIKLKKIGKKTVPQVLGSAIIKDDKLIGFLDSESTKTLIFIKDEIKGGLLIENMKTKDENTSFSLEIYKNKTKISPLINDNEINMNIDIETTVSIGEIIGSSYTFNEEEFKKLEQSAENTLKEQIEAFIKKMQSEYNADIFGFGSKLWENEPQVFKSVSNKWDEVFKDVKVNVKTKVIIKNTAIFSEPIRKGE